MAKKDVLQTVQKLVKLAQSENEEEARTAALTATRLMQEHRLVLVPQDELERVNRVIGEARELAEKYKGDKTQNMLVGALCGFMAAKQGLL
jgi:hypothetical protein